MVLGYVTIFIGRFCEDGEIITHTPRIYTDAACLVVCLHNESIEKH